MCLLVCLHLGNSRGGACSCFRGAFVPSIVMMPVQDVNRGDAIGATLVYKLYLGVRSNSVTPIASG